MKPKRVALFLGSYLCLETVFIFFLEDAGGLGQLVSKLASTFLSILIFYRLGYLDIRETFRPPPRRFFLPLAFIVSLPFLVFSDTLVSLVYRAFPVPSFWREIKWEQAQKALLPEGLASYQWLLDLSFSVITAGICEELIFRGVALVHLAKTRGRLPSLLVVSCLFALVHGDPWRIPGTMLHGLYFGFLTFQSGSFWPAALVHGIWNLWAVIQQYDWQFLLPFRDSYLVPWIFAGSGILSLIGLRWFVKKTGGFSIKIEWSGPRKHIAIETALLMFCFLFMAGGILAYSRAGRTIVGLSRLEGSSSDTERRYLEIVARKVSSEIPQPGSLALSPRGDFLAYISKGSAVLLNLKDGKRKIIVEGDKTEVRSPLRWAPQGSHLAFAVFDKEAETYHGLIYDVRSGRLKKLPLFTPYAWLPNEEGLLGSIGPPVDKGKWDIGTFLLKRDEANRLSSRHGLEGDIAGVPTHIFWTKDRILLITYDGTRNRSTFRLLRLAKFPPVRKGEEGIGGLSWMGASKGASSHQRDAHFTVMGRIGGASLSPSLDKIVYDAIHRSRGRGELFVYHLEQRYEVCRLRHAEGARWLNAGNFILSSGSSLPVRLKRQPRLKMFDLEGLVEWQLWGTEGLKLGEFDCTPDGRRVAFVRDDGLYLASIPIDSLLRKEAP